MVLKKQVQVAQVLAPRVGEEARLGNVFRAGHLGGQNVFCPHVSRIVV